MRFSNWDFSFCDLSGLSFSSDVNCLFGSPHLNVCLRWQIWTDSTMSSVSSSSSLGGSVNLNVFDGQVLEVFSVGIWLQIVDQTEDDSDRFFGPSTESFTEFLGLPSSSYTTEVVQIGYTPSVGQDVFEILFGFGDRQTFNGISGLVCVFIMDSKILSWGSGNYDYGGIYLCWQWGFVNKLFYPLILIYY